MLLGLSALVSAGVLVWMFPVFWVAFPVMVGALVSFLLIARADACRVACVSLLVDDLVSGDVEFRGDRWTVVCAGGAGSVARLSRRRRRRGVESTRAAWRRLPVALASDDSTVWFVDRSVRFELGVAEVAGALAVVDGGVGKRLEVVYGAGGSGVPEVLAVRFASSEGAVESHAAAFPVRQKGAVAARASTGAS